MVIMYALMAKNATGQHLSVSLNTSIKNDIFEKSLNPLPVFKLSNSEMEMTEAEGRKEPVKFKAVLPAIPAASDTSYFFLYFGANIHKNHGGYIAVVVINSCNRKDPILYVDRNLNYNFTDDGEPLLFKRGDAELVINLVNPSDSLANLSYRITRFNLVGKDHYRDMMDEFYRMQEKSRVFRGLRCSFREQRYNCKGGTYYSSLDSITIGLMDVNCNGVFTDAGVDKILVADAGAPFLPTETGFGASLMPEKKAEVLVEFKNTQYRITKIDPYGNSIEVERIPDELITLKLAEGSKAPKIIFTKASGRKFKLNRYRRQSVYLYFVRFPYENFTEDTTAFVALRKKYPKLKLVWIHYGGNPKSLQIIAGLPNVDWYCAYSNRNINKLVGIGHFPMGILLEKKRKVKKFDISPQEVEKYLPQN